jgi:uncharacterized membrane protein YheB (UPF0754 family)
LIQGLVSGDLIKDATIPIFSGFIGYATNWSGVWMLFNPLEFKGVRLPGLRPLANVLPRRIQQIPGVMQGGVGWQGIIPSRAAKMGSIAVDKGIAKVGSPAEFYEQLDPEKIAQQILVSSQGDMRDLVERIMAREHPELWGNLPPRVREAVHERVQQQLPDIVRDVTKRIGANIDDLLDVKLMVIRHLEEHPELCNRIFLDVGQKELRFIIRFGGVFGFVCGFPLILGTNAFPHWWVLPVLGTIVGYVTNWLAIWMIFEPVEPRRMFGRWRMHGLFLRRKDDVSRVYAGIIADDVITVRNIGNELLYGPRADRTRAMIQAALHPAVDRATGTVQPLVRIAVGPREYDAIRESLALEGVEYTITPLQDESFNREQSSNIRELFAERIRALPYPDFSELLRSAMREDEWLLVLHGAVLGFGAGLVHLALFGV